MAAFHLIYIGLGSNLVPRTRHLVNGIKALRKKGVLIQKVSSLYRTSPVGFTDQPFFLNAAAKAKTKLSPFELLELFKQIERNEGRGESVRFDPRTLDLDLLWYDNRILRSKTLSVPHPRMTERKFVLVPLLEISPTLLSPEAVPYRFFLRTLNGAGEVKRYRKTWLNQSRRK